MTLDEWLTEHHDPNWKFKPYSAPKATKCTPQRGREFKWAAKDYDYHVSYDRRTILEPVTLEEFLVLKHDPKWKPKKRSAKSVVKPAPLGNKERQALQREVSAYVASHQRKVAA